MSQQKILLVNDFPGTERVAAAAMLPILSERGFAVSVLPTVLLSNPLNYSTVARLDTTEFMRETIAAWEKNKFQFDCICTGFLGVPQQAEVIRRLLHQNAYRLTDPIMGDHGKLYRGVDAETVNAMRQLVRDADVVTPNQTEAAFLTGQDTVSEMLRGLLALGAKSAVVTGVQESNGERAVYGLSEGETFRIPFEAFPKPMLGTGDSFSAVLIANLLQKKSLYESATRAADFVTARMRAAQ